MAKLDDLFAYMKQQGASDLHLTSGSPPVLRIHGSMKPMNYRALSSEECQGLIFEILNDKHKREFGEKWELDTSYHLDGVGRFRVNVFMQRKGMGAVFRLIPETVIPLAKLNMPPVLSSICQEHKGLVVVTGPTGSGKSTTLAAMIDYINDTKESHILTVEDPIEFVHENKKSLINQREVNSHTKSFANALKAALREDPDIILVGEMRDLETIQLAMTAAETGHLVFGTLHTNNAPKTVDRIIDVFPQNQQAQIRVMLSESLKAVIAQGLLKRADGQGRVAVPEILINTKAVGNLIREGKTFQIPSTMQTGSSQGMLTFAQSIDRLLEQNLISGEVAAEFLGVRNEEDRDLSKKTAAAAKPKAAPPPIEAVPQKTNTTTSMPSMPSMPKNPGMSGNTAPKTQMPSFPPNPLKKAK